MQKQLSFQTDKSSDVDLPAKAVWVSGERGQLQRAVTNLVAQRLEVHPTRRAGAGGLAHR